MSNQVVVILDTPLLDSDPWADAVFRDAALKPVDNHAITRALSQDSEAKKAILAHLDDPMGSQEILSPHYRKALKSLYGDEPRLGIYGTAWLVHVDDVAACVVDWSELIKRTTGPNVSDDDRNFSRAHATQFLHKRVERHLPDKSRYLELETGLPEAQRIERTMAFLRERGAL